jgi:hypothetical protein
MVMKGKHIMPDDSMMKGSMKGMKKVKRAKKYLRSDKDEETEDKD